MISFTKWKGNESEWDKKRERERDTTIINLPSITCNLLNGNQHQNAHSECGARHTPNRWARNAAISIWGNFNKREKTRCTIASTWREASNKGSSRIARPTRHSSADARRRETTASRAMMILIWRKMKIFLNNELYIIQWNGKEKKCRSTRSDRHFSFVSHCRCGTTMTIYFHFSFSGAKCCDKWSISSHATFEVQNPWTIDRLQSWASFAGEDKAKQRHTMRDNCPFCTSNVHIHTYRDARS